MKKTSKKLKKMKRKTMMKRKTTMTMTEELIGGEHKPSIAKQVGNAVYLLLRANCQNKIYLTKMQDDDEENELTPYFGICCNCGGFSWMELYENEDDRKGTPRYNWLCEDGSIRYPNMKKIRKMKYRDVVCSRSTCECPCVLLPAKLFDREERVKIMNLSREERIKFIEKYLIADNL